MDKHRLLQRFLRYVRIDTTARADAEGYPSSPGQLELGRLLVGELQGLGIGDARQDRHGIVWATVPATVARLPSAVLSGDTTDHTAEGGCATPVIALCSHLDTSPETTGAGVKPQVVENYAGGDVVLPGVAGRVIAVADNPELEGLRGRTLITSDGTTLLGADDKAGVAIIVETAAWLVEHPEILHGPVRICFTCDEEIGRGVDKVQVGKRGQAPFVRSTLRAVPANGACPLLPTDVGEIDAVVCYTLDGHGSGEIDVETFSADQAVVTVRGVNIHPSIAKDRMTNAVRVAADFVARLPREGLSPEATDGREGFLHPYDIAGGVAEVKLKVLLRDFEAQKLIELADRLRRTADDVMRAFPAATIEVNIERQYRNMAEGLLREPRAVAYAEEALRRLGRTAKRTIVRGGTDGSRLSEMGLPTPNLSCGSHNPHSPLEWACLEEMVESVEWLVALTEVWGEE
jgi:tripeptide aminopeptidase